MKEASSLDDALKQQNRIWGTEDNIFAAYDHPLHETYEDLLYRQEPKDLLRKHSAESIITNSTPGKSLKENVSLNAERGRMEKAMTSPRALLHVETRDETALVKQETDLLEEPTCACLSPLEDQCEENLTTCSVSTTNSYECSSFNTLIYSSTSGIKTYQHTEAVLMYILFLLPLMYQCSSFYHLKFVEEEAENVTF